MGITTLLILYLICPMAGIILFVVGVCTFATGCNTEFYPLGCMSGVCVQSLTVNTTTVRKFCGVSHPCFFVSVDFGLCAQETSMLNSASEVNDITQSFAPGTVHTVLVSAAHCDRTQAGCHTVCNTLTTLNGQDYIVKDMPLQGVCLMGSGMCILLIICFHALVERKMRRVRDSRIDLEQQHVVTSVAMY